MTLAHDPFTTAGLFDALGQELDPTLDQKRRARRRYQDLGEWLQQNVAPQAERNIRVYPQGSFRLGTTNRDPFTGAFDIDAVVEVEYLKSEITQRALNLQVNGWLGGYVSARQRERHPLAPTGLRKGKRAWTLQYQDSFHMDTLPVVPDSQNEIATTMGDPAWLTDKLLHHWQPTNPIGFAQWFLMLDADEREKRIWAAKRVEVDIVDLPVEHQAKTRLQLAIQLFKRHRDHTFGPDPKRLAPPSAVITALAARAFASKSEDILGLDADQSLQALAELMPSFVSRVGDEVFVVNPTCVSENYADRYAGNAPKRQALWNWLARLASDLELVRSSSITAGHIDAHFGVGLTERVAKRLAGVAQELRSTRTLGTTSAGALAVVKRGHRQHTFYGGDTG